MEMFRIIIYHSIIKYKRKYFFKRFQTLKCFDSFSILNKASVEQFILYLLAIPKSLCSILAKANALEALPRISLKIFLYSRHAPSIRWRCGLSAAKSYFLKQSATDDSRKLSVDRKRSELSRLEIEN